MSHHANNTGGRRSFLKGAAGVLAAGFWADEVLEALPQNTNTNSKPSDLRITDLRIATIGRAPMTCPIIRIDTNQGIYGLGEVRDGASKNYALMLKSRLLRENPCNVDKLFRKIKQFGGHSRQAGGVCGVEMALWDLAGKAFNVPVYQMLGGKFRDMIRIYCDTTESPDPKVFGERLKARREQGFTWLKMDLGVNLVARVPGAITMPAGASMAYGDPVTGPLTGTEITPKGAALMAEYVAAVREQVGMDVPLSADHFGHIGVNSCIRLAKALEPYNLSWLEDMVPWQYTDLLKKISDAVDTPILTGEDIYLKESFITLAREHAVDIVQPDLATSGGILETKKIGDACQEYGVPMAMHFAGTPVSVMANVHCAAATENFLVMENHSVDVPWWDSLVEGVEKPIVNKGFIAVPDKPGLGITLNDEVVKQHLAEPGFFEPTPQWNIDRTNDRQWS
jgi:L-alanine-DL-glutamate epimerase-like enolase superfamily enzyme